METVFDGCEVPTIGLATSFTSTVSQGREIWLVEEVNFLLERSNLVVSDVKECILIGTFLSKLLISGSSLS